MTHETTCCFSGHRTARLPWGDNEEDIRCIDLKARLNQALETAYQLGYRHFLCGMAQGADLYFCEAVLALQARHAEITLEAAIPFVGQADYWPQADRLRRDRLLNACTLETVIQHAYTGGCMSRRNRYMVDRSTLLIAVYDGFPRGGTLGTISYAKRKGLSTLILDVLPA